LLGARCSVEWQWKIKDIADATGRKEAEIVREAIAQYLGETDKERIHQVLREQERCAAASRLLAPSSRGSMNILATRDIHITVISAKSLLAQNDMLLFGLTP
jgi:RHH-type rel operon transcriptional repressor/antitoxin RelB